MPTGIKLTTKYQDKVPAIYQKICRRLRKINQLMGTIL